MKTPRSQTIVEELDAMITEMEEANQLKSWTHFIGELQVPNELAPAFMTMRPELVRLATPRDMSATEVAVLYELIRGLVKTNGALRTHAINVAKQVGIWSEAFKQLQTVGRRIEHFAEFRRSTE